MAKEFTVKFYSDPGHGWGAVKIQKLYELGIADKISSFSYQKGGTVYLEEDCDMHQFLCAAQSEGCLRPCCRARVNNCVKRGAITPPPVTGLTR